MFSTIFLIEQLQHHTFVTPSTSHRCVPYAVAHSTKYSTVLCITKYGTVQNQIPYCTVSYILNTDNVAETLSNIEKAGR